MLNPPNVYMQSLNVTVNQDNTDKSLSKVVSIFN